MEIILGCAWNHTCMKLHMCACGLAWTIRCKCDEWLRREADGRLYERLSQHATFQDIMRHHQPQLYITGCCSHTIQQWLEDREARWCLREMVKAWNWVLSVFFLKSLFKSCKDSISLFVYKSNHWSQGDKRPALPLMDTQKHESIWILTQHTHTLHK